MTVADDKLNAMREKIAKLLAKAEGTSNDHEAQAFSEAAERLMVQYGIARAELESVGTVKSEKIIESRIDYDSGSPGYNKTFEDMACSVARALVPSLTTLVGGRGGSRSVWLVGHESDVRMAEELVRSIELQARVAVKTYGRTSGAYKSIPTSEKFYARVEFLTGYGVRVASRLSDLREDESTTVSTGAELVFVGKKQAVDSYLNETYTDMKPAKAKTVRSGVTGFTDGWVEGQNARLGGSSLENRKELS